MSDEAALRAARARRGVRDPRWRRVPRLLVAGEALLLRELVERWTERWPELRPLDHLDLGCAVARGALRRHAVRPGGGVYRYSLPEAAPEARAEWPSPP